MLTIILSPSRILLALQCLLHAIALVAVQISSLELRWQLIVTLLILSSAWQAIRQANLKSASSVLSIEIEMEEEIEGHWQKDRQYAEEQESCIIAVFPERRLPARLVWFYCLTWIQLLAFKHRFTTYIAVVLPDSVDKLQRRELRAYLRSSSCLRGLSRRKNSVPGNG
jgi:hypothetical protein